MQDLLKGMGNYVMSSELHLTYLVTPVHEDVLSMVDREGQQWCCFSNMFKAVEKNKVHLKVAEACGIDPNVGCKCAVYSLLRPRMACSVTHPPMGLECQ